MTWQIVKVLISAVMISFAAWLSGKRPALAGFIISLPLATLLALAFSHSEYHDTEKSVAFAKSIFYAIPLTLVFFIPFLLAEKLKLPFWGLYGAGVFLLVGGYLLHTTLVK